MKKDNWNNFTVPNEEIFDISPTIYYADNDNEFQTLYVATPKEKKSAKATIIFFHGGGLTADVRECPATLYNGEFNVIEVRYRLSQNSKAPSQIYDAAQSIAWCFSNADKYNIDKTKIFIGGMSAGAYLAAITVMNKSFLQPYNIDYTQIAGLLLISGQMSTHFKVKEDLNSKNVLYNPLFDKYAPLANLHVDLPPILMVTGDENDILARPEENAYMAASLKAMGHEFIEYYKLAGHCHGGAFESCDYLMLKFINKVIA